MSAELSKAKTAAEGGFWNTANGWAAIAQAEALERIAVALEAQKPEARPVDPGFPVYGVGGYGSQER